MSKPAPVGYFVWCRSHHPEDLGPPHFPKKFMEDFMPVAKDSKQLMEQSIIGQPVPLMTQEEYDLSLDELAKKYPRPQEAVEGGT